MANNKIDRNTIPSDFTLSLVLVDAIPVIFFGASMITISILFQSILFMIGAVLCFLAGVSKVLWKLIVVLKQKNIWFLFIQMRIIMPLGFLLMILSLFINHNRVSFEGIKASFYTPPSFYFFIIGILGMILMMIFSIVLDSSKLKTNWIEQITNGIAQGAILVGLLFLL